MISILIFFIAASLLLYILLGGSDFGAGIFELMPGGKFRDRQKRVINRAMGPVWEANHIWLILIVVILFMGFPQIFTTLMISLHIPFLALLVGIVIRGTVFTFRHYDAVQEPVSQRTYTWLFGLSSLWSSVWLGIIAASLTRGTINPNATEVWEGYFAPWWGAFPLAVGFFVASIFGFLASVFLIDETPSEDLRQHFHRRARTFNIAIVITGGIVFLTSLSENPSLAKQFATHPLALASLALATVLFVLLWRFISQQRALVTRIVASGQVVLILFGWWVIYSPNAVITTEGPLGFYENAAPRATQFQLVLALLIGSLLIFPSLAFLLRVFKFSGGQTGKG